MAAERIDTSGRPSMVSVQCGGGDCTEWIVVDRAFTGVGFCSGCLMANVGHPGGTGGWSLTNMPTGRPKPPPPPGPAVYPPSVVTESTLRPDDPNVSGYCLGCPIGSPQADMHLRSLDPDDIAVAFAVHRQLWHSPTGWLIGGPGGADGDVCNPCGGGGRDKGPLVTTLPDGSSYTGPRHDLCLRGNPRGGWGRKCPCKHDRPYMRGIKPGEWEKSAAAPGSVGYVAERLAAHRPAPQPPPAPGSLFDPEDLDE